MTPPESKHQAPFLIPDSLETERLFLRFPRSKDWKNLRDYYTNPEATRYTTGRVLTESETWQKVATMVGHWHIYGYGPYVLELKANRTVIGVSGPWYPIDWPSPEIKWGLAPSYWGQGLAAEAVTTLQKLLAERLPDIAFISFIDARNEASIRLAERVHAKREETVPFRGGTWHLYRHPRS